MFTTALVSKIAVDPSYHYFATRETENILKLPDRNISCITSVDRIDMLHAGRDNSQRLHVQRRNEPTRSGHPRVINYVHLHHIVIFTHQHL